MAEIFLFNEIAKIELLFLYLHLTDSICAFLFGVGGADESSRTLELSNARTVGRSDGRISSIEAAASSLAFTGGRYKATTQIHLSSFP